jgi:predicted regulator of Ras-like GTPase activity (Roadblock/LC7/MglB family)
MSFLTHLESVVNQVDGALACSVMGFDGIAVETHQKESLSDVELQNTWVEYANVVTQLRNAAELLRTGEISEVSINTERVITLMRMVTTDYFLVLAMKPDANYGKGRYVLRVTAPKVKSEL